MSSFPEWLESKRACSEAREWVGNRDAVTAWRECERGDWMLWALGRTDIDRREIVRLACDVALCVLPLSDDPRVAAAIDAAEGWCAGKVTIEELREARRGASAAYAASAAAAAYAASAAAADYAAYASAASAASAYAYAAAADDAAYAAYAADDAAAYAAAYAADDADDAWRQTRADAVREIAEIARTRVSPEWFAELVTQ